MEVDASIEATPLSLEIREMIERSLKQSHPIVRAKALEAALRANNPAVLPLVAPALSDPDPRVQSSALEAFVQNISVADPGFLKLFRNIPDPILRCDIIDKFARREDIAIEPVLAALLEGEISPQVRLAIVKSLSDATTGDGISALVFATIDENAGVRRAAEPAMRRHRDWLRSEAATQLLGRLDHARIHENPEVQHAAMLWTERIRGAQIRRTMFESGVAPVMAITAAIKCPNALLRQAAAESCIQLRDARAVPGLIDLLSDQCEAVRRAAAIALWHLEWHAETEEHHAAFLVAIGRLRAAAELGGAAVDALLLACATSSDTEVQSLAVECLAHTHSIRAMVPLSSLLETTDLKVRAAAARALKMLEWVPPTAAQALVLAIALQDWMAVAAHGAPAVGPLITELKKALADTPRYEAIGHALLSFQAAEAAEPLLSFCQDGEVAATAVAALDALLQRCGNSIPPAILEQIIQLDNVMQFTFTLDAAYQRFVRTGYEPVDVATIHSRATSALGARSAAGGHA
jgi:HEAT repeat protein